MCVFRTNWTTPIFRSGNPCCMQLPFSTQPFRFVTASQKVLEC